MKENRGCIKCRMKLKLINLKTDYCNPPIYNCPQIVELSFEGKSWMQCYVEAYYGYSRVIRLEIRNKTLNIFHALSKLSLQTTDVFLFNDTRATNWDVETNYAVLELIKDVNAISSKYNSHILTFKVPNIVIVFSNYMPNEEKHSKDMD